ncbi:MAG: VCBS repeat-containing protein [Chryseolinea sp.]
MKTSKGALRGTVLFILIGLLAWRCGGEKKETLFIQLDSTTTNINFVNKVPNIKGRLSIVDYLYYYNGGGVAAGDVNNDGLTDLFFVSNLNKNKLYLNKGNLKFEDVSEKSDVGGFSEWKTGVTMADVNGDGWLDIYVCAVVDYMGLEGSNELFINNGDGTFTEKSSEYGLDFTGFSTQATFFDYDHDGDLDMYLLNHAVHTSRSYDKVIARTLPDKAAGDYLFRNDDGKFKDVSAEANIYQAAMGYGLGIAIGDINNDGWEDIYVTNDFHEDDYCYINNHDGTFSEKGKQLFKHFSRFSMGCDIADVNNDGFEDVMTLDMYPPEEYIEKTSQGDDAWDLYLYKLSFGYHHQFIRNCLQISNGGKNFSDWSMLSGVAATDWSWSVLMNDFNNDGIKDIFVSNGIARRPTDLDYLKFSHEDSMLYAPQLSTRQLERAIARMPEGKIHNYIFEGDSAVVFKDRSSDWGFEKATLSNGAAYADLDNDGDLDIITNNLNEPSVIYQNRASEQSGNNSISVNLKGAGKNTSGIGAKVFVKTKSGFQMQQLAPTRGFLSSVDNKLIFGVGKNQSADSVIVVWNDGSNQIITDAKAGDKLVFDQKDASESLLHLSLYKSAKPYFEDVTKQVKVDYKHNENKYLDFYREGLMPFLVSTEGPKIAVGDVNGDGLDDFYIGGAKHQDGSLFIQKGDQFIISQQETFSDDSVFEDVDAAFFDADNDQDLDLYVVSGGNEFFGQMPQQLDRLYMNDGKGSFTRNVTALPPMLENKSCVRPFDFDHDGDMDLFVGGRVSSYHYGRMPQSFLLQNDGKGNFKDVTESMAPDLQHVGMVTDALWVDLLKNGKPTLVVVGDWMKVSLFENKGESFKLVDNIIDEASSIKNIVGFWQCLAAADFDNDGDLDLAAGNLGLNSKLIKRGDESAMKMYIADLDANGQAEQIVTYTRPDGKYYPIYSKDELGKQIPGIINKKYTSYKQYAAKSIEEIFDQGRLDSAKVLEVNQFASVYMENVGGNKFRISKLPVKAQLSKAFTLFPGDFNNDRQMDLIEGGNYAGGNTYQNDYDASYGIIMEGNGKGMFTSKDNNETGLTLEGEIRDIKTIRLGGQLLYLVARNNGPLQIFKAVRR